MPGGRSVVCLGWFGRDGGAAVIDFELSSETGGVAMVSGFLVVLVLLFIDPSYTLSTASTGLRALFLLLVFPVAGLLVGLYAYVDGPYHGVLLFLAATYLGIVGLTMVVGFGLSPMRVETLQGVGLLLFVLSLLAILVSVQRFAAFVGFGKVLHSPSGRSRP